MTCGPKPTMLPLAMLCPFQNIPLLECCRLANPAEAPCAVNPTSRGNFLTGKRFPTTLHDFPRLCTTFHEFPQLCTTLHDFVLGRFEVFQVSTRICGICNCRRARAFNQEYGLPVGADRVGVEQPRVLEYCSTIQQELWELCEEAKTKIVSVLGT